MSLFFSKPCYPALRVLNLSHPTPHCPPASHLLSLRSLKAIPSYLVGSSASLTILVYSTLMLPHVYSQPCPTNLIWFQLIIFNALWFQSNYCVSLSHNVSYHLRNGVIVRGPTEIAQMICLACVSLWVQSLTSQGSSSITSIGSYSWNGVIKVEQILHRIKGKDLISWYLQGT